MKTYEGMFLFDTGAARDWAAMVAEVRRLCERIGANLLVCVKFDERKLAFEIKRRKRGTYALTYFEAPPERLGDLERDARLSELILRALVLRVEPLSPERLALLQAHPADTPLSPHSSDRRGDDDRPDRDRGYRGDRDRDRDRGDRGDRRDAPRGDRGVSEEVPVEAMAVPDAGGPEV